MGARKIDNLTLEEFRGAVANEAADLGIKRLTVRDKRVIDECYDKFGGVSVLSTASSLRPYTHENVPPSAVKTESNG